MAEALRGRGVILDAVISSPLVRARQTAREIVASCFGIVSPEMALTLGPASSSHELTAFVKNHRSSALLLIGHQPDLGFVSGQWGAPLPAFGTACVAAFLRTPSHARPAFQWFLLTVRPSVKDVVYTAAHGGFSAPVLLGGGAAICRHLLQEWTATRPFQWRLLSPDILGTAAPLGRTWFACRSRTTPDFAGDSSQLSRKRLKR